MGNLKTYLSDRDNQKNSINNDKFLYSAVPGQENVVKVSFYDEGKKQSVLLETFSDEQFELFDRLKNKVDEFRSEPNPEREQFLFKH